MTMPCRLLPRCGSHCLRRGCKCIEVGRDKHIKSIILRITTLDIPSASSAFRSQIRSDPGGVRCSSHRNTGSPHIFIARGRLESSDGQTGSLQVVSSYRSAISGSKIEPSPLLKSTSAGGGFLSITALASVSGRRCVALCMPTNANSYLMGAPSISLFGKVIYLSCPGSVHGCFWDVRQRSPGCGVRSRVELSGSLACRSLSIRTMWNLLTAAVLTDRA